jgi:hypothetical protein
MNARFVFLAGLLSAGAALAWNYDDLWNYSATAARPGGGGLYGTGSKTDKGLQCHFCHPNSLATVPVDLTFAFSPGLVQVSGQDAYVPGQVYTVTATMTGATLAEGQTGNVNNFAAMFESAAGNAVGTLASDTGQVQGTNCPSNILNSASLPDAGTTLLSGSCKAIYGRGRVRENLTQWRFTWTAPAAGTGTVTIYWGATDGDKGENSIGDLSKNGTKVLLQQ